VAGGGSQALADAGIEVQDGVLESEAAVLYRGFFARMQRGRPWVVSKIAASLDGRTALASGASRWITGEPARRDVHRWRARAGAILTGSGTIVADDPALTARRDDAELAGRGLRQPLRAIVDARLRTPPAAKAVTGEGGAIVFATAGSRGDEAAQRALEAAGARIERMPGERFPSLAAVLERLAALEVNEVLVEAGAELNGALLAAGLVDELVLYFAPLFLGHGARAMLELPGIEALSQGRRLVIDDVRPFGADLRIVARPSSVAHPSATAP
jgi:diaminohydroxyphosphoribosylaminopyrimidine deaminase/5-amino-6-(5-phosphoribosylamino)uracil reductase